MHKPDHPYFALVSQREALIKVHVISPCAPVAPTVTAVVALAGANMTLALSGPAVLPTSLPDGPGVVEHSFEDSFTATIPAGWVRPGLSVTVRAGGRSVALSELTVGAPTKVPMVMFDVYFFTDEEGRDYPAGWRDEIEAKWPVRKLKLQRVPHVVFPELVIPARSAVRAPSVKIRSAQDYRDQTGVRFDGEQAAAVAWNGALKRAAGLYTNRLALYYLNIYVRGVASVGGQAGGFSGVGQGDHVGVLHHELGHALSLPHWCTNAAYPYHDEMYGIPRPCKDQVADPSTPVAPGECVREVPAHAGPTWAYDPTRRRFIPPTTQADNPTGRPAGHFKNDPMCGGSLGSQEPPYLVTHFSDYSVRRMREYLEDRLLVWNGTLQSYAAWDQSSASYSRPVVSSGNPGAPVERDVGVVSIMASVLPNASMVYPPIGPYTSSLVELYDPTRAADRRSARAAGFCPADGCDVSVRVLQGGEVRTYLLAASWDPAVDPYNKNSLATEAVNVPASDGAVTQVDLLLTPDGEDAGLPDSPLVLHTWPGS